MTQVSPAAVVPIVRSIAEAQPEFVYSTGDGSCHYVPVDNMPGCIVGQALEALGIKVDELGGSGVNGLDVWTAEASDDLRWLMYVQQAQDMAMPWGKAIELADQVVAGSVTVAEFNDRIRAAGEAAER